ncbi:MAG: Asp23/Gls24 family envelope stress response protein [Coriobacteriia bacterium]|nr:Asp23/Gls24 family envelope stress response protein [Coriobacteriia bacterium]
MADIKKIDGKLVISSEVFEDIALKAASNCYGVVGISGPAGVTLLSLILPKIFQHKGVIVTQNDDGLVIDVYVILEYGTNVSVVCKNLSDNVRYQVGKFCDIKIDSVNVHVKGMRRSR